MSQYKDYPGTDNSAVAEEPVRTDREHHIDFELSGLRTDYSEIPGADHIGEPVHIDLGEYSGQTDHWVPD